MIDLSNVSDEFKAGMAAIQEICASKSPAEQEIISKFCGEVLQYFCAAELLPADNPDLIAARQASALIAEKAESTAN